MDKLTIMIDEKLKKKLKIYVAKNDTNISRIVIGHIKKLLGQDSNL